MGFDPEATTDLADVPGAREAGVSKSTVSLVLQGSGLIRPGTALKVRKALSIRAYDAAGMMVDAEIASGDALEPVIERMLAQPGVAYLHAHNAGRGCYAAQPG